jgi:exosome complex RNA-binding protein Csl4
MSDLKSDMSGLDRICPVTKNFEQRKSRSGAQMMRLGPDKLTISKLGNIELRKITGATRSKLNSRNQT